MLKAICACLIVCGIFAGAGWGQTATPYPVIGSTWYSPVGYVPASSTAVVNATVLLNVGYFANTTGSAVTVTLVDQSTACSSGPCTFWPAVSLAANQVYTVSFGGIVAVGGVKWSASGGTAVVGYLSGQYPANLTAQFVWPLAPMFAGAHVPQHASISVFGE